MTWDVTLDFEYVVTKKPPSKICFGTSLQREVLPVQGPCMSSFMRRNALAVEPNIGPGSYDNNRGAFYDTTSRIISKHGLGSRTSRWLVKHEYQPPPSPLKPKKRVKQNCAPFNSTSRRKSLFKAASTPAPCDYLPDYKHQVINCAYSFQGKRVLRCAVNVKCVPYNLDECGFCGCSCSAQGDYWQFENRVFLCRKHYNRLFTHCLAKFQGCKLKDFKSVRDCFFAHAHNSCKAAVKIMKQEEIVKLLRKEAYLDLYFPQRRFCGDENKGIIMKLDSNNKMINSDEGADLSEEVVDPRQNAEDIIDEILADFTESRSGLDAGRNGNGIYIPQNIIRMMPPRTRTPANSFSENATLDDIDPASDLGASIRNKCLELEEILQSLKSRLNRVVLDANIVLSPEANSMEAQLEHDLDTDCQEDLSLQEFLELLQSQNKISPTGVQ